MGFKSNSIFLLLLISIFLNGCQSKVYLMPAPIALNNDGLAFELSDNPNDNNLLYTMYATNRKPAKLTLNNNEYSIFPSDLLRLGFVVHRVGESNMTWDDLQRESLKGDRTDYLLIEKLWSKEMAIFDLANNMEQQLDQAEGFFDTINKVIDNMFNKDILLYVHGANSNFYRATAQGAQYFHFTGHNSVVVTFSWPSAENLLKYKVDVLHAKQTVPAFSQLIEVLARHTKAKNINILAYSAGAQVVAPGLAYLRDKYPELTTDEIKKKFRLGELYLALPVTHKIQLDILIKIMHA